MKTSSSPSGRYSLETEQSASSSSASETDPVPGELPPRQRRQKRNKKRQSSSPLSIVEETISNWSHVFQFTPPSSESGNNTSHIPAKQSKSQQIQGREKGKGYIMLTLN
jgi:hypothetical protein